MIRKRIKKFIIAIVMSFLTTTSVYLVNESKYILVGTIDMPIPNDIEVVYKWNEHNYTKHLNNAIQSWNNSGANISFNIVEEHSEKIYVDVTDYAFGNIGWHAKTYSYSVVDSSPNIQINNSYYPFKGNGDELIAHELGHILRLADVSDTEVLMRSAGYKGSSKPEEQDIEEVNLVYKNKSNAKLEYYTEDVNELIVDSDSIFIGSALKVEKIKVNNSHFQIVDFRVDKCVKGQIDSGSTIKIIQTCDIVQEPLLKKNNEYLLFTDPYIGDIVEDAYVAKGLHHGIYRINNENIQAVSDLNYKLKENIEKYSIDDLYSLINPKK